MPNLGLKVKTRKKEETKLPFPCRHNQIICAINGYQDSSCQEPTDVKKPLLPYDEPDLLHIEGYRLH